MNINQEIRLFTRMLQDLPVKPKSFSLRAYIIYYYKHLLLRVRCKFSKGLCEVYKSYLPDEYKNTHSLIFDYSGLIQRWRYYSDECAFPIPATDSINVYDQYYKRNKWKGRQLELRVDLISFILLELKKFVYNRQYTTLIVRD